MALSLPPKAKKRALHQAQAVLASLYCAGHKVANNQCSAVFSDCHCHAAQSFESAGDVEYCLSQEIWCAYGHCHFAQALPGNIWNDGEVRRLSPPPDVAEPEIIGCMTRFHNSLMEIMIVLS